jgi:hypothetical protein
MGDSNNGTVTPDRAGAHVSACAVGTAALIRHSGPKASAFSPQAEIAQDEKDNHDQADDVDDPVHGLAFVQLRSGGRSEINRSDPVWPAGRVPTTTWISLFRGVASGRGQAAAERQQTITRDPTGSDRQLADAVQ